MEYVTVEFYFDESKDMVEAKNAIMNLFKSKEIACTVDEGATLIYKDAHSKTGKVCWVLKCIAKNKELVAYLKEEYLDVDGREDVLNGFLKKLV